MKNNNFIPILFFVSGILVGVSIPTLLQTNSLNKSERLLKAEQKLRWSLYKNGYLRGYLDSQKFTLNGSPDVETGLAEVEKWYISWEKEWKDKNDL